MCSSDLEQFGKVFVAGVELLDVLWDLGHETAFIFGQRQAQDIRVLFNKVENYADTKAANSKNYKRFAGEHGLIFEGQPLISFYCLNRAT